MDINKQEPGAGKCKSCYPVLRKDPETKEEWLECCKCGWKTRI